VNNVFSNLFGASVNTSTSRPLSLDWLIAPGKGAIVVFGNTWDSYATTSDEYLERLYPAIFSKSDGNRGTIGQILQDVALQTKLAKGYTYDAADTLLITYYNSDRANIHQVLLQGDPALRILLNEAPLSTGLSAFNARLAGEKVDVAWEVVSEKSDNQFVVERSYDGRNFEEIGSGQIRIEDTGGPDSSVPYVLIDLKPLAGTNYYRLKQVDFAPVVESSARKGAEWVSRIVSVEFDKTAALSVSPNPSTEYFEIKLNIPTKISKWKLIDINGRLIKDNGTGNRVNITNLSPGEYILEVVTANGDRYSKKIVKQ
jgi:hypothetical protein